MGRNNTQSNTKTQNTQNKRQNVQIKKTTVKRINIKKHKTISYNETKSNVITNNNISNHVLTLTKSILRSVASLNTKVWAILFGTLASFLEVRGSDLLSQTNCSAIFLFPRFHRKIWWGLDSLYSYIFCLFLLSMLRLQLSIYSPLPPFCHSVVFYYAQQQLYLVHIRALMSLYRRTNDTRTHILLNQHFTYSNMFKTFEGHLQEVQWIHFNNMGQQNE